jgi:hypothetical protein
MTGKEGVSCRCVELVVCGSCFVVLAATMSTVYLLNEGAALRVRVLALGRRNLFMVRSHLEMFSLSQR